MPARRLPPICASAAGSIPPRLCRRCTPAMRGWTGAGSESDASGSDSSPAIWRCKMAAPASALPRRCRSPARVAASSVSASATRRRLRQRLGRLSRPPLAAAACQQLNAEVKDLLWSGGGFTGACASQCRFRLSPCCARATLRGDGTFSWQNGQYAFTPSGCVQASLAAFHPGASDLAKNVQGEICAPPQQPLLTGEGIGLDIDRRGARRLRRSAAGNGACGKGGRRPGF